MLTREQLHAEHGWMLEAQAKLVRKKHAPNAELKELMAWGTVGLYEAADRYDDSQPTSLETFAYYRVRGAMIDGLRKSGMLSQRALDSALREAAGYAGAEASGEAIEESGGMRSDRTSVAVALEQTLARTRMAMTMALLAQEDSRTNPEEALATEMEKQRLHKAIAKLDDEDRRVVTGMHWEDLRHEDLAQELGMSRSNVSKIYARALKKLFVVLS